MSTQKYLEASELFDIAKYDKYPGILKDCVPFVGSPRKHPYDGEKILLVCEPTSTRPIFYEFLIKDIAYVEEKSNLVNEMGEAIRIVQIWIPKGKNGIRYVPFEIDTPLRFPSGYDALCGEP